MKEHLVHTDSVQSGLCEVSDRGQALSSAEQSSERWREETSLFVPCKKLEKSDREGTSHNPANIPDLTDASK